MRSRLIAASAKIKMRVAALIQNGWWRSAASSGSASSARSVAISTATRRGVLASTDREQASRLPHQDDGHQHVDRDRRERAAERIGDPGLTDRLERDRDVGPA